MRILKHFKKKDRYSTWNMVFFCRNLILLLLATLFLGCESKKLYDISSDPMLNDLNTRITTIEEELATMKKELEDVDKLLKENGEDIDFELKNSLKKELIQGEVHEKDITQWLSYLKIQRKQRYKSLHDRKSSFSLVEEAKKESEEYFIQNKLKPIDKTWLKRYRTAIEM